MDRASPAAAPADRAYSEPTNTAGGDILRIYIAGPMTGHKDFNYPAFFEAEQRVRRFKHIPLNPARHGDPTKHDRPYYLRRDLQMLAEADAIAVLPGWDESAGACMEVGIARQLRLPIFDLDLGGFTAVEAIDRVGAERWIGELTFTHIGAGLWEAQTDYGHYLVHPRIDGVYEARWCPDDQGYSPEVIHRALNTWEAMTQVLKHNTGVSDAKYAAWKGSHDDRAD